MNRVKKMLATSGLAALLLAAPAAAETWTFDVQPGADLNIDLDTGGEIRIDGAAGNRVTIQADVRGRDAENVIVEAAKTAGGVEVSSRLRQERPSSSASADLVITVPAKFDVEISSMGGEVHIAGVEGSFSGKTMGGALHLKNLRGRMALSTMGGEIHVDDSDLSGEVSTMGGDITFRHVAGDLKGSTMGGHLRIVDGEGGRSGSTGKDGVVTIETMGGPIDVARAPQGARVSTMGGPIRIDAAREFVKATTMGGDIVIREVDGKVEATTMGGDIDVRVIGTGGDIALESLGGDLELTLPADFSGTFDLEIAYTRNASEAYHIRSDFPVNEKRTAEWEYGKGTPRKYIRAKSAIGQHKVSLSTINGNIVIHRSRS